MSESRSLQEYISADEYARTMEVMQKEMPVGGVTRERNRRRVAADILETFDLIGGVSAFSRWADENPSDFYRMWAKLAPPPDAMDPGAQVKVIHVVPRSPLDE